MLYPLLPLLVLCRDTPCLVLRNERCSITNSTHCKNCVLNIHVGVVQLVDETGAQMSPFVSQSICLLLSPFVSICSGNKWRQMETSETNGDKSKKGSELEEYPLSPKSPKIFWRAPRSASRTRNATFCRVSLALLYAPVLCQHTGPIVHFDSSIRPGAPRFRSTGGSHAINHSRPFVH